MGNPRDIGTASALIERLGTLSEVTLIYVETQAPKNKAGHVTSTER